MHLRIVVIVCLPCLLLAVPCGVMGEAPMGTLTLVENGNPQAVIVVPQSAATNEMLAAAELQSHIAGMSGAKLEVVSSGSSPDGKALILVGGAAPSELDALIRSKGEDPASFAIVVDQKRVCLRGLSTEGTLFAAYELLEQLGVRWFIPGDLGTVIPEAKTLALKSQTTIQVPSFAGRWHGGGKGGDLQNAWGKRMRMGGPSFPSAHGIAIGKAATFENHPEYYGLVNGKRVGRQLCVTNPEVLKLAVQELKAFFRRNPQAEWRGVGPNDGGGFCECDNCRALDGGDWDAFSNERSVTDRYIWFFNQLLKGIEDEFPDKKLCFYAYHTYMRPPVKVKPDPRIVPAMAVIALCRIHGPNNPVCPEKDYYQWLVREWKKVVPEVYDRGYWFNLADPGFPFSEVHRLREEIPLGAKLGLKGWRVETMDSWASETPTLYIAAKLMWNANADVDALVRDFNEKFFGPAAKPMGEYLELMDHALRDGDFHTGSSFNMPDFHPADLRAKASALLKDAAAKAGDGVYRERVKLFELSFAYLEAFIHMLEHRNAFEFDKAYAELQKLDALRTQLLAYKPPMLNPRSAEAYLKRFFRLPVEQGYKRTTDGNEIVAALKDEWDFQIDPLKVGEDVGLWRADITGPNWQKIRTSTASWSDQGLRYYKGIAWYRQVVDVPAQWKGRRVFFWCGGIDEKAKVWVNGREIGISPRSVFVPFELDATGAIQPGGKNVVTICVNNEVVNELGTGGIVAPVMFYAPAAGKDAQLENARELSETFP